MRSRERARIEQIEERDSQAIIKLTGSFIRLTAVRARRGVVMLR